MKKGGAFHGNKTGEKIVNGVNVEELLHTIDLIKEKPDIAKFKFRARNHWMDGTHNRATVKDFYGALKEDDSRRPRFLKSMNRRFSWVKIWDLIL